MKALPRPGAPDCISTDTEERTRIHRERYANLRFPSGGFRDLWNLLDKDESGVGAVRRALLALSGGECAYCGRDVGNDHMQVDHILPKEEFPFLAYAWENLLPSCDACNRRKKSYVPPSLQKKRVVERCLVEDQAHDFVFDKPRLFGEIARAERLVDPSFDDPAEHIELLFDFATYRPKDRMGQITHARLLRHPEIDERLAKVREAARVVVETPLTEAQLAAFAIASSHPSLFRRFAAYWIRERDEGRLPLWPEPGESSVKPG
jgi:uncharacterized protein (TIGR02646 family)